jgi:DNA-binding transcriptional regulator GbsR (MarR family)
MDLYGAAPSVGALYGIMFFEDRPMTLEEMKEMMGMSKRNMSYAARALLESKIIVKLDTPAFVHQSALKDLHKFYHAVQYYDWLQAFIDDLREGRLFERSFNQMPPTENNRN